MPPHDICIVGGGPAGLAAALALTRKGFDTAVLDAAVPPIDKACGEGLMPDSAAALRKLEIELTPGAGQSFRGIRFLDDHSSVHADFPNGVQVNGHFLPCRFVIGADGQNSQIRHQAGLHQIASEHRRFGFRRHYRIAPWSPYVDVHWGSRAQLYISPIAPDEVCVALISRDPKLRLDQALTGFPQIRERLETAVPVSRERGGLSLSRTLRRVSNGRIALIGDASGSVDAITGEGISLAFHQALLLADALAANNLLAYEHGHRLLFRRPRQMASLMLLLERFPTLQPRAIAALARRPEIFRSLLAIHVGQAGFLDLCSWRLLDFGLEILTA